MRLSRTTMRISSPRPSNRPSSSKRSEPQKKKSASVGKLVAIGAELRQARVGAMLGEIARDDAGLQHAAERDRAAARRPGEAAGDRVVGGKQQRDARHDREAAAARPANGTVPRRDERHQQSGGEQRQQHRQRRGVGRGRERDQGDQRPAFPARERFGAQHHEIERQHREACEDVGEQRAHDPGQRWWRSRARRR